MTLEQNFLILCENFLLDDKQRASLINLYDVIWTETLPVVYPKLLYVANIKISNSEDIDTYPIEFSIKSPSGVDLFPVQTGETKVETNTDVQSVGGAFEANYVALQEYGSYNAVLKFNGKAVAQHSFEVKKPIVEEN